jgi:hypothetical protein
MYMINVTPTATPATPFAAVPVKHRAAPLSVTCMGSKSALPVGTPAFDRVVADVRIDAKQAAPPRGRFR